MNYLNDFRINVALQIASPALHKQLQNLIKGEIKSAKKIKKLEFAFYKYLIRISTRSTPFGIFAGYSNGIIDIRTSVVFDKYNCNYVYKRNTFENFVKKSELLLKDHIDYQNVKWHANTTLYEHGHSFWRYFERHISKKGRDYEYTLESIAKNEFIDNLIAYCKKGRTFNEIKNKLKSLDVNIDIAVQFIENAIKNQIIVSNLEPNVTGKDFPYFLSGNIKEKFNTQLNERIDLSKLILEENNLKPNNNAHYDLIKVCSEASFNKAWISKLKKAFAFLNKINLYKPNTRIENFKNEFTKRYGTSTKKFAEVLDPECGINYLKSNSFFGETTFLENLDINLSIKENENLMWWGTYEVLLNKKMQEFSRSKKRVMDLKESDFVLLETTKENALSPTMFSIIEIFSKNKEEKLFLDSFIGPSAIKLISKFGSIDNESLELIHQLSQLEKNYYENKIIAEIVHTPSLKIANVLRRPHIREFEIPYLGHSTLPIENQILVSDLLISIKDDKLILESIKLNKEIIPTLTCAHNYSNSALPTYQFLADLGLANYKNKIGFEWGNLASIYKILPRVEFEGIVISKAKWILEKSDFNLLFDSKNLEQAILEWRKKFDIPKIAQVVENDNFLVINFESLFSINVLLDEIKHKKWIVLEEFLFDEGSPVIDTEGNYYANEFLLNWHFN
ncbi:Lantibiotic dehydratase, C terminus [Cellulophaga baltica]|uniref:Lantibiotic dehydratase, C terminus n=2 Tax=Cellulophaga baltica TaxID=76594 RepID=A0A1G7JMP0_9FLAO|nr:Lantibiotic dehydratase, C terminus [Cellulophaga baltica]